MTRRGFMLIELAVATLVIGVGLLVMMGLASVGERAATEAEDETRAALFADDVFTTLRLYSDHCSRDTNVWDWVTLWRRLAEGEALPLAAPACWQSSPGGMPPLVCADRQVYTNRYLSLAGFHPGAAGGQVEYGLQYRLALARPTSAGGAVPFLPLDPAEEAPRIVWATLHVWSGAQRRNPEPFVFYTHFSDAGGLP